MRDSGEAQSTAGSTGTKPERGRAETRSNARRRILLSATVFLLAVAAAAWRFAGRAASPAVLGSRAPAGLARTVSAPAVTPSVPAPTVESAGTPPAVELPEPEPQSSWAKELAELKSLAAIAPQAALARVALYADKHERKAAAKEVCLVVSEKDPAAAMTAAWHFDLGRYTDEASESAAVECLAERWAKADLPQALAWANAQMADDESRRDRVWKGIATAVAKDSPALAARLVNETVTADTNVHAEATLDVLRRWAATDYKAALAWAAQLPDGAVRDRGIDELANAASDDARKSN